MWIDLKEKRLKNLQISKESRRKNKQQIISEKRESSPKFLYRFNIVKESAALVIQNAFKKYIAIKQISRKSKHLLKNPMSMDSILTFESHDSICNELATSADRERAHDSLSSSTARNNHKSKNNLQPLESEHDSQSNIQFSSKAESVKSSSDMGITALRRESIKARSSQSIYNKSHSEPALNKLSSEAEVDVTGGTGEKRPRNERDTSSILLASTSSINSYEKFPQWYFAL